MSEKQYPKTLYYVSPILGLTTWHHQGTIKSYFCTEFPFGAFIPQDKALELPEFTEKKPEGLQAETVTEADLVRLIELTGRYWKECECPPDPGAILEAWRESR